MEAGWERKRAYEKTKAIAETAVSQGKSLKDVAENDREIASAIEPEVMQSIFDPRFYIRYAGRILRESGLV
jgi:adenylosuccinate lyase